MHTSCALQASNSTRKRQEESNDEREKKRPKLSDAQIDLPVSSTQSSPEHRKVQGPNHNRQASFNQTQYATQLLILRAREVLGEDIRLVNSTKMDEESQFDAIRYVFFAARMLGGSKTRKLIFFHDVGMLWRNPSLLQGRQAACRRALFEKASSALYERNRTPGAAFTHACPSLCFRKHLSKKGGVFCKD
jgi:hypothetical protein